jgi:hypothetical protein
MAKAPYDTTCDIIDGPGSLTPGTIRHAGVPCRLVSDNIVFQREKWMDQDTAYVTMDESDVHAAFINAGLDMHIVDGSVCDRLAIPSGAPAGYTVLWTEAVNYAGHPTYYRAHVRPVP